MLDEPSLEFAATAVALVLVLRAFVLSRAGGPPRGQTRVDSARARDLIGLVLLAGAVLYAWRAQRATPWFLTASAIAVVAQIVGFYLRKVHPARAATGPSIEIDEDAEEDIVACPICGHHALIDLEDSARLLGGLSQLTAVVASVCPACGALSGVVEDPAKIPIGPDHGTSLRKSAGDEAQEALQEPAEHDG